MLNKVQLPPSSEGLINFIFENTTSEEDKKAEYSCCTRSQLLLYGQVMQILQDEPATHKGSGKPGIKELSILCTLRGLVLSSDLFPVMGEILTLARDINKTLENDEFRVHLFFTPYQMLTRKKVQKRVNFYPGKITHQAITSNSANFGLNNESLMWLYFLLGICDYDFPVKKINVDIREILSQFEYLLLLRKEQLIKFSRMYYAEVC